MNTPVIDTEQDQEVRSLAYTQPMRGMPSVEAAEELAREPLGNRWAHTPRGCR